MKKFDFCILFGTLLGATSMGAVIGDIWGYAYVGAIMGTFFGFILEIGRTSGN